MERPRKLRKRKTTGVSQTLQVCTKSRKDRFSNLPDDIAHRILCFLPTKDLLKLRAVSKRCNYLCLTIPSLTLDIPNSCNGVYGLRVKRMNCYDRILVLRQGKKMQKLRICWHLYGSFHRFVCEEHYRIVTWLHVATLCNVEALDLDFRLQNEGLHFSLPPCIFLCASFKSLTVNLNGGILQLPSLTGFTNLQSLSIKSVGIVQESFSGWISSFCNFLKQLCIEDIKVITNISIKSSSLESFVIVNPTDLCHLSITGEKLQVIRVEWRFVSPRGKSLKISAPNLKHLAWNGNPTDDNYLGELVNLERAELYVEPKPDSHQNLSAVLCSISRTKDLFLHDIIMKALFEQGGLPTLLYKIQSLCMFISSFNDDLVPAMVSLLRGMPNLKTVCIKCSPPSANTNASGFNTGFWESQDLKFIYQLEVVEMELFNGENELALVLFLLKHAKELKKMIIFHSIPLPSNFSMKINEYKMISTATVIFQKRC